MKLIKIIDRNKTTHYINPTYIVRLEDYAKMIIIYTSDGAGIRADIVLEDLMKLLEG